MKIEGEYIINKKEVEVMIKHSLDGKNFIKSELLRFTTDLIKKELDDKIEDFFKVREEGEDFVHKVTMYISSEEFVT